MYGIPDHNIWLQDLAHLVMSLVHLVTSLAHFVTSLSQFRYDYFIVTTFSKFGYNFFIVTTFSKFSYDLIYTLYIIPIVEHPVCQKIMVVFAF